MKSEMKNQLLRALIRELKMYTSWEPRLGRVWLNSSIDMIQVQGFQYDPVYYQLLEPLSTGVQQRFSHTFGKYFILFWRHHGALWSTDCHPPGGHSSLSTTPSYPTPAQVSPWKMNERLQWKLLADIIIHLHLHYHHLNISSTPTTSQCLVWQRTNQRVVLGQVRWDQPITAQSASNDVQLMWNFKMFLQSTPPKTWEHAQLF